MLLDLMLPDMTRRRCLPRAARARYETPIIVLSVVGDEKSKVAALDEGADDYLTKPFGTDELLARIRVALRRGRTTARQQATIVAGGLTHRPRAAPRARRRREVHLTPTEYSLLKYLATNAGRVLTHPMILRAVWGAEYAHGHARPAHVHQSAPRQARRRPASPRFIRTDPGVGYRFVEPSPNPDQFS